jgi:hypothetical protein
MNKQNFERDGNSYATGELTRTISMPSEIGILTSSTKQSAKLLREALGCASDEGKQKLLSSGVVESVLLDIEIHAGIINKMAAAMPRALPAQ